MLIGVRDDGTPVGIRLGDGAQEQLSQRILAATDPRVYVRMTLEEAEDVALLRIDIAPGDGPHLANGRAFTRLGPETVQMSRDEYERRLLHRLRDSAGYERQPVTDVTVVDLDLDAMRLFAKRAAPRGVQWDEDATALLDRLHLLAGGRPTIGAVLLFSADPQRVLPQATVRVHVQRGALEEGLAVEGPLMTQVERTIEAVQSRLRTASNREGIVRQEVPELPLRALREAIVNALVHRDYRSTAPVQIRLTDSQLSVWNPGHLPAPLTIASLRLTHPSVPANPRIARAMYLAGYVEEWGTGTLRVVSSMAESGNPEPTFAQDLGGITVRLPLRGAEHALLTPRQSTLLNVLRLSKSPMATARLSVELGVSTRTVQTELATLETLGLAFRQGQGRAVRWSTLGGR